MKSYLLLFSLCVALAIAQDNNSTNHWRWYRSIRVKGGPRDLSNFVVEITTNTENAVEQGKMKPDGSDIRFSNDLVNITDLPYKLLSGFNTSSTRFQVEFPEIKKDIDNVYYLLMGNTEEVSVPQSFSILNGISSLQLMSVPSGTSHTISGDESYYSINVPSTSSLVLSESEEPFTLTATFVNIQGSILGVGKGYQGSLGGSAGPGKGGVATNAGGGGASHAGQGGRGGYDQDETPGEGGTVYGSPTDTSIQVGSSGGGTDTQRGGHGGGAIRLIAREIRFGSSSIIDVSGEEGKEDDTGASGGGSGNSLLLLTSGGSLLIQGDQIYFYPSTVIKANGGSGGLNPSSSLGDGGGGAGGGRVKIFFTDSISNTPEVEIEGGEGGCCGDVAYAISGTSGSHHTGVLTAIEFPTAVVDETLRCLPTSTCSSSQVECGFMNDGCQEVFCGWCLEADEGCTTTGLCLPLDFTNVTFVDLPVMTTGDSIQESDQSEFPVVIVASAAGGFVVLVIIVVIIIFIVIRVRKRQPREKTRNEDDAHTMNIELQPPERMPTPSFQYDPPKHYTTPYQGVNWNGSPHPSGGSVRSVNEALGKNITPAPARQANWEINYNDIEFDRELGRGAYANWRMQWVAVKKLKEESLTEQQMEDFKSEASLYMNLRPHKNVVVFLGVCTYPLCIVTEYLSNGSVEEFIRSDAKIDMLNVITMAIDIAAGMSHLHAEGIIHRDLATRNLLLDDQFNIKITDFGMSRVVNEEDKSGSSTKSEVGPLKWMAPESIVTKQYSTKSDVFMFGVTLIELLTRNEPYPGELPMQVAVGVVSEGRRHPVPDYCSSELRSLLQDCWVTEPADRPEFPIIYKRLWEIQSTM